MNRLIQLLCAAFLCACWSFGATTNSLTQYGITWYFSTSVTYGQFANGDYWVLSPVTVTNITPQFSWSGGHAKNGSELDPGVGDYLFGNQGYDNYINTNYNAITYVASLNVASNIVNGTPLTITGNHSLVSSITRDVFAGPSYPQISDMAVLTAVDAERGPSWFRPQPYGTNKYWFSTNSIRWSLLPNLPTVSSAPALTSFSQKVDRMWNLSHSGVWSQYTSPSNNAATYPPWNSDDYSAAILALCLTNTTANKTALTINAIQVGIDVYGALEHGMRFRGAGGFSSGRKLPVGFAGLMLNNSNIMSWFNHSTFTGFTEDTQCWYVTADDVGKYVRPGRTTYSVGHIGMAEWGVEHHTDESWDNSDWVTNYRDIMGKCLVPTLLSTRLLGIRTIWNNPVVYDYGDRYWTVGNPGTANSMTAFTTNMWTAYRTGYEVTNTVDGTESGGGTDPETGSGGAGTMRVQRVNAGQIIRK